MKLNDIANEANKLPLDTKEPILKFIEYKTNDNMEKILTKIEALEMKMTTEIKALNTKIDSLQTKMTTEIKTLDTKMTTEIKALDTKINTEIKSLEKETRTMQWFISGLGIVTTIFLTVITIIVSMMALKH
ncbi:MAG: hypothetical protein QM528_07955 [Phycisphaerales bacterium]|nr:hypothetical protein [Phycisphaerales bacterium]